jgi:hypothetical protein
LSGFATLSNLITTEFVKDECPKAPILLYAIEGANTYREDSDKAKFDLFKLNRGLWMGEMLENFDMVIPFDCAQMQANFKENPLIERFANKYQDSRYHRGALQSLVMRSVT